MATFTAVMQDSNKAWPGNIRTWGYLEGFSYLLLLFIAMPLKYMAGIPEAVKYTGWVHGLLS